MIDRPLRTSWRSALSSAAWWRVPAGLGLLVLLLVAASRLAIEWQWFSDFDAQAMLLRRWLLQLAAFVLVMGLGIPLQLQQLQRCWRLRQQHAAKELHPMALLKLGQWGLLTVLGLLLLLLALGLTYLMVQAHGLITAPFSGQVLTGLPALAELPKALPLLLALVLLPALLLAPLTTLRITLAAALAASATALARGWSFWLPALMAVPFGRGDPLTGLDLSFTVLQLPALRLILSICCAQAIVGLAGCLWLTLSEGNSLSELNYKGLSRAQQRVLQPQLAALALVVALSNALAPFDLMVQGSGVASGAGWVDLHLRLPLRLALSLLLLLTAGALLVPVPRGLLRRWLLLPLGAVALLLPIGEVLLAPLLQRLIVQPRELSLESPYLARSIAATRRAFGLERMRSLRLNPQPRITAADLASSAGTLDNIRLWDSEPLLSANRQLQQLRLYYRFSSAAVDRYTLRGRSGLLDSTQQVLISARELDSGALPVQARTWLNRHLVFTNGHGFTVSPVNVAGSDGLPLYFVKNLGRNTKAQGIPQLGVSNAEAQASLPVGRPSLYMSSGPSLYAIAPTKIPEFAFPEGDANIYLHYSGRRGISLAHPLSRLAAAVYLAEPRLLFTGAITPKSLLLIRRQVNLRLAALAPFLQFESEPYLVTARIKGTPGYRSEQHQYWLLDGFTSSRSYPYSDPNPAGLRYFRNPVKAVVDAHDGRLWLYVSDPADPLLRTWRRAFPELFLPLAQMPPELLRHIKVPTRQFTIQTERLLRYHVTNVRTFYNGDDVWSLPYEIYGARNAQVRPYHVTLQLPGRPETEFVLLQPFTPLKRTNLVGWLVARNDPPHYGQMLLALMPQQRLVLGPQQVSALVDQDPTISFQFGLWNRIGSSLFRGNLLVLPVGQGVLYVEPIYLRSRSNNLPTLVRVVVTDGRRFVMDRDLGKALARLVAGGGAGDPRAALPVPAGRDLLP